MGSNKDYFVNWKNHMNFVRKAFDDLLTTKELTDVTLCCEGEKIQAHKLLLSACSTFFREALRDVPCKHPVIIMYGVDPTVLRDILHFIYNGEVSVDKSNLDAFLKLAQYLKISGLTDIDTTSALEEELNIANCEPGLNETFIESSSCDTNRGIKRARTEENEPPREKLQRQEEEIISEIKTEPPEVVSFDPLDDSLQTEQKPESNNYCDRGGTQQNAEEDFKIEVTPFFGMTKKTKKSYRRKSLRGRQYVRSASGKFCSRWKETLTQNDENERILESLKRCGTRLQRCFTINNLFDSISSEMLN